MKECKHDKGFDIAYKVVNQIPEITDVICSECKKPLLSIISDLRAKLEAAEKNLEVAQQYQEQYSSEADALERKNDALQKQVAGMREALDKMNILDNEGHCVVCGAFMFDEFGVIKKDHFPDCEYANSLSTPPTAYEERVKGLVEELSNIANTKQNSSGVLCRVMAREALVAFRGCE